MRKLKKNQFIGVILFLLGIIILGQGLYLWNFNILFDGWWTLFIIIPAIVDIYNGQNVISSLLVFLIGMIMFFVCQGMIAWGDFGKYIVPLLLMIVGLSLIFRYKDNDLSKLKPKKTKISSENPNFVAIGCGNDINVNFELNRGNIVSLIGNVDLDLRKSIIKNDITFECICIFGSVDIIVPEGYQVVTSGNTIFGSNRNVVSYEINKNSHMIYINYTCIFGKINIR